MKRSKRNSSDRLRSELRGARLPSETSKSVRN